ncbi:MAG TPA: response regulator [Candidatus Eisenbacteria bacterium]|nr:response regulator [Candidatus Eisenbacteria bacterium]
MDALSVLLVEDSEDDRFLFQHAFDRAQVNAKLFVANDGQEAVDYFQHQGRFADPRRYAAPDVVFLDLKMPGRNGFEVLQWMQERSLFHTVKVIVLSGSHEPRDIEECRKLGAHDYVVKPIDIEHLQRLLRA